MTGPTLPDEQQRPSKTRLKQQMHDLQALGRQLVELSPVQLQRIDLPERLRDAVQFARQVSAHEARRRQLQFIGRLMRDVDADAIRAALDAATGDSRAAVEVMHRCERLRDRLLDEDQALTEFLAEHPAADAQWLRSKLRAARHERVSGQAPRHARELYRWLHDLLLSEVNP